MSGRHITDHQAKLYLAYRNTAGPALAAARAGFSLKTAHRIEADPRLPSLRRKPRGRRRPDPLAHLWDSEIVPMLQSTPGLRPFEVFQLLCRRHPELPTGVRRTLERRVAGWRRARRSSRKPASRGGHDTTAARALPEP